MLLEQLNNNFKKLNPLSPTKHNNEFQMNQRLNVRKKKNETIQVLEENWVNFFLTWM